ncbi:iron transporter [Paractinoplanes abujensis]|uniref:Siderophore synthetase component n=1 Tax=Paractinoplanes abujensis TaxID=882441 RepID=A0A7W7CNX9_9ACTN|nr:IucA/IucC family siderophore biosynthesis protein [Actinoplanes abujensis]MBB4691759.1 siderophore synthetase component [Actinoplanes abujensis]GID16818.1 iron transporter [Actinoplanes abujensis]
MPRSPGTAHTAGPLRTRAELASLRPDLVAGFDAELPGARAAVLSRLLGAVARERLPGLLSRQPGSATFAAGRQQARSDDADPAGEYRDEDPATGRPAVTVTSETVSRPQDPAPVTLRYPTDAALPFARPGDGLSVTAGPASITDPAELVRLLWGDVPLAAEIDNSVANLALARADRPTTGRPEPGDPDALGRIEQLVTDGHPLHPCCRTRGGMTVADVLAYGPEHSPVIRLQRLRVPDGRWYGSAAPILYAHPWQARRLLDRHPWLRPDGQTEPVRPLMSLRTVAPVNGGPHIKTAVDVQMTSAVRTVSPAAVHNGPVLSALLRRLVADQPIDILAEIAAGAVIVDGHPQRHLAHVIREAPQLHPGELAVPLAAIGTVDVDDPYEWMTALADVFFAPVTCVLARGVALEAHGQNTLVVLRDGRPRRILYRDLGGVRVSPRRLRNACVEPPPLRGDLTSDDPGELRTKLAAAAFGTVAAEVVATLTRTRGADPDRLWAIVARAVRATGTEDVPSLLKEPLPVKATTAMRLATDPLHDQWALIDNPMTGHA